MGQARDRAQQVANERAAAAQKKQTSGDRIYGLK